MMRPKPRMDNHWTRPFGNNLRLEDDGSRRSKPCKPLDFAIEPRQRGSSLPASPCRLDQMMHRKGCLPSRS